MRWILTYIPQYYSSHSQKARTHKYTHKFHFCNQRVNGNKKMVRICY